MFERILVPLDGSKRAEHAIPVAAHLARAGGGSIVFVRVVLPPHEIGTYGAEREQIVVVKPDAYEKRLVEAEHYLQRVTDIFAPVLAGIPTKVDAETGAASSTIFSAARLEKIDLIVLCSQGVTGLSRWIFGSVAQEALRQSPVPIFVLNEPGGMFLASGVVQPMRILIPLDGSALSEAVLQPALQLVTALTSPTSGELHLLYVVDVPATYGHMRSQANATAGMQEEARQEAEAYLKAVVEQLQEQIPTSLGVSITWSVVAGSDVVGSILKQAEPPRELEQGIGYTAIAMATHGRSGLRRLAMGSVTEHVLGATRLPLLIVRPQEIQTK